MDVNAFETNDDSYLITRIEIHDFVLEKYNDFLDSANQKEIEPIDPKLTLLSEKTRLSRILDNLISNAIKYSDNSIEVIIKADRIERLVSVSVKEQGSGFSKEDQDQMYKKFKRLSARPTGGESSNGLGLAIVKTLTERLKGEISLETSENGTLFTVSFPDLDQVLFPRI